MTKTTADGMIAEPETSSRRASGRAEAPAVPIGPDELIDAYRRVRGVTELLCEPLGTEDYVIQTMPDVSPTKWHLAHTTWFFEQFILQDHSPGRYEPVNSLYDYLFNSYYNAVGPRHCRPRRGLISRPTVQEVLEYRRIVDDRIGRLLQCPDGAILETIAPLITLGIQHEQQHQELMITDIKHVFSSNPLLPAYREHEPDCGETAVVPLSMDWVDVPEGVYEIGTNAPKSGRPFAYDNETPRHRVFLEAFRLATYLVRNAEFLQFIQDGGYQRPEHWLSFGWATVTAEKCQCPLYWFREGGDAGPWLQYTLAGAREIDPGEPVCHLSYFEADAFARWAGARLPTEAEWEVAASAEPLVGHFADSLIFHPRQVSHANPGKLKQIFGDVWEWTSSSYEAYPGFEPPPGAVGEYNAKFMCNQYVLRGGSCATPVGHVRRTYRNFFPPDARWQFSGIRLAKDA